MTDDGTPFELSVVLHPRGTRAPEIRLLAEPRSVDGTLRGTIASGLELGERLEREFGASLARARLLFDRFLPRDVEPQPPFALWYAAAIDGAGRAKFKLYFNPKVRGESEAPGLVEEMMSTLGLGPSWKYVAQAMARGPTLDDLRFVSLDLEEGPAARIKVYVFHRDALFSDVVRAAAVAKAHDDERLLTFLRTVTGGEGILAGERQVGTCLSFVGDGAPVSATTHVPVRVWAGNDGIARARIEVAAEELGLDAAPYRAAIDAFAHRPLANGRGLHSYASLRTEESGPRLNLYLSPELYATEPPRPIRRPGIAAIASVETPLDVVRSYEHVWPITAHPYLTHMARDPQALPSLALLLLNFRIAITRDFSRRLAQVVARVEEDELRCVIAHQLAEELGNGKFDRAHRGLFEKLAAGMEPLAPPGDPARLLAPGHKLGAILEDLYVHRDPYEGLGATLIMEVYGRQVDQFMGAQLRRQATTLPAPVVEWLTLHEELEVEHVDEVTELAGIIPPGAKAVAAARGARELGLAGWRYFDDLYELMHG